MKLESLLNKNHTKNVLKYLNEVKLGQGSLNYASEIKIDDINYQVVCNGYSIAWLENHLELPKCHDTLKYPNTITFFNGGQKTKVNIDVEKLYELSKQYKARKEETQLCCIKFCNEAIYLNIKYLMDLYKVLGTTEVDAYVLGRLNPILLKDKKSNSKGVLYPVRFCDDKEENVKDVTKYEE